MARLTARIGLTRFQADEHYRQALDHYRRRNLDEAIISMNHAISTLPNHAEYYASRGFFHLEDDNLPDAQVDFEKARQHNRYEMLANYGLGVIAYRGRHWEEALQHFNDAWAAAPARAETLYYLALTHHRMGNNITAQSWMRQAHEQFEAADNKKQSRSSERWLRELEKLADAEAARARWEAASGISPGKAPRSPQLPPSSR